VAIPDMQDFMLPILKIAGDGYVHSNLELYETLAQEFGLTEADRMERIDSDRDWKFNNRVRFACTHLRKAHLLSSTDWGKFRITVRGMNVLRKILLISTANT
jgi:restriction system protein